MAGMANCVIDVSVKRDNDSISLFTLNLCALRMCQALYGIVLNIRDYNSYPHSALMAYLRCLCIIVLVKFIGFRKMALYLEPTGAVMMCMQ